MTALQRVGVPALLDTERTLNHAEYFRAECKRLMAENDKACKRMQDDYSKHYDLQVKDHLFLKKELQMSLEEITLETDAIVVLQCRVAKALEACTEPLRITTICLEERMKYARCEKQRDEVDMALAKEKDVFQSVISLLQSVAEQMSEQIRLNRSAKYQLEQDLKEKLESHNIDSSCALMCVHSIKDQDVSMDGNCSVLRGSTSHCLEISQREWENLSELNVAKAEQQKKNSMSLRALVESVLQQTSADLQKHVQATTAAFEQNIQQLKESKKQMDDKLPKILEEISNQQQLREDLLGSITETERFLKLAESQLAMRQKKPCKEKCMDPVQCHLLTEVQQLTTRLRKLQQDVAHSERNKRELIRCRLKLQESISIKASCLYIDEVVCLQKRRSIVIPNF